MIKYWYTNWKWLVRTVVMVIDWKYGMKSDMLHSTVIWPTSKKSFVKEVLISWRVLWMSSQKCICFGQENVEKGDQKNATLLGAMESWFLHCQNVMMCFLDKSPSWKDILCVLLIFSNWDGHKNVGHSLLISAHT